MKYDVIITKKNVKYLRLYKIQSGKLIEIEYSIESNKISFVATTNDQIVVLEELDQVERNTGWVFVVVIFAVICLMLIISINIIYVMSKKRNK